MLIFEINKDVKNSQNGAVTYNKIPKQQHKNIGQNKWEWGIYPCKIQSFKQNQFFDPKVSK